VVMPTQSFQQKLIAARLAADVMGVPTVLIARTDACGARYIENDSDPQDHPYLTGERRADGCFGFRGGLDAAIARGLAYAPHADMLLCQSSQPDLRAARRFAEAIHNHYPGKLLAYNYSPPVNWSQQLDATTIRNFQVALSGMGYRFQFVALAGYQSLNMGMLELARRYREAGMAAFTRLHEAELERGHNGEGTPVKSPRNVGGGYLDEVARMIGGRPVSRTAMRADEDKQQRTPVEWAAVPGKTAN